MMRIREFVTAMREGASISLEILREIPGRLEAYVEDEENMREVFANCDFFCKVLFFIVLVLMAGVSLAAATIVLAKVQ